MKKILSLIMASVMMMACLCACGSDTASSTASAAGDTANDGKLVIATSPDFPPFEELQSDGSIVGIEVDIMNIVAERLGKELSIEQMNFDSVVPGIQAGKFDVGVSGISVTEERQKNVLFTDPYCLAAQAIVVPEGSAIASKADLDGKTVSVQTGTTAEQFCQSAGYTVNSYEANSDAEMAAVNAKVDAWVIDDLTAASMVADYNASHSDQLVILDEAMTTEPYAFCLTFGNEDLCDQISEIVNGLVEDGTVASIFEKYDAPYTSPLEN